MSKECLSVYVTKNYGKFKTIEGNRVLRQGNLEKIKESMKEKQLILPICVNENFEIIDGQHRFNAAKELELPVYYYIIRGYKIEDVERANRASTNWTFMDFLNSYVLSKVPAYVTISEIIEEYPISLPELLKILSRIQKVNSNNLYQRFKDKKLEISDSEKAKLVEFLKALSKFNFFSEYKKSRFVSAFFKLYSFPGYNQAQMEAKLNTKSLKEELVHCNTIEDYLSILANKIYSAKNARSKYNIYYNKEINSLYKN